MYIGRAVNKNAWENIKFNKYFASLYGSGSNRRRHRPYKGR